ncbi:glycosyl hydrolase [Pontibacter qinzhouensis]|uniref:Glycosyl hydrolase n=1 Tax=Pontibacter qinzhouensis TaxID=2603253 RepID=A0A5C8K714_9BACT|nr:glycoside hydrolase family 127 protein [Pontibacter qinzhouensis]TXK47936.1 glycosyl hydrolase [Pontibacter qinzhouensis]
MKLRTFFSVALLAVTPLCYSQTTPALHYFPLNAVSLAESPFLKAQQTDMQYILEMDVDRLLAPFLKEAGLPTKAQSYGNWENTGLDGHIGGHYLTALSLMYASTKNEVLLQRLNYMVAELAKCQQQNGNGYVGGIPGGQQMWQQVAAGKIEADNFSLNKKWVPLYNIHKIYAGLIDAYRIAGNQQAREVLVKLSDWCLDITKNLTDAQMQQMLRSEHGGLNETFADVAEITGDKKYLALAERFSHQLILEPLLAQKDVLNGMHANTQIPKVIGYKRVADVAGSETWDEAAGFFWNSVINNRTVAIGGNSVREHFHPSDNFTSMIESEQGPETCNTYNMLKLTKQLFATNPDVKYLDYYERALYNHILSSQHPTKGGFVYFTPMRPRHYRVYSSTQEDFWCCVGSGLENHGKYGELIYAHNDQDLFVNLFIPSTLQWQQKGLTVQQKTNFPFEEGTQLQLNLKKAQKFALNLRYPGWVKAGEMKVKVNGKEVKTTAAPSSFVTIDRKWKNKDVVTVELPMHTKAEFLPDGSSWASFVHGPIVLAGVTDTTDIPGLWGDGTRMGHVANGQMYPIDEAPVIVATKQNAAAALTPVPNKPLTFTAAGAVSPEQFKNVKLVPFFQVHEARYMLYWPVLTPEEKEKRQQILQKTEQEKLALEAKTVDQVAAGEQQPESDHNFKGEGTDMGTHRDRFWRHATNWFSYDLRNKNREAKTLRITYFGQDNGRTFDILVNDVPIKTVKLDGSKGDTFFEEDYQLPQKVLNAEKLTVKFVAHKGSVAGGVYHVRLLK